MCCVVISVLIIRLLFCTIVFPVSTMKSSRPAPQEQCGVWLDPVELKSKVKKVNRNIPSNPFYSSLVLITHSVLPAVFWYQTIFVFQKQPFRPISNLLNPLAGGDRYSLAVALNFTQTKIEMPNVKQSSISSFFTAQRRGQWSILLSIKIHLA